MRAILLSVGISIVPIVPNLVAAPYEPGTGWREFTFSDVSVNGSDYFNDEEPFTFTVRADQQPRLHVANLGSGAERYRVFNGGASTSFITPQGGNGVWGLQPGSYSLRFWLDQFSLFSPNPIRGQFQVEILPVPQRLRTTPAELGSCLGKSAAFRVNAEFGEAPFTYQWYFNRTNLLAGETNSLLHMTNLSLGQAGQYSAVLSNAYGSAISPPANLKVFDACVGMSLYAGLSVTGIVGRTYSVESINDVTETNWTVLATNTMTQSTWLFIDTNTPFDPKRFFRVRIQPD